MTVDELLTSIRDGAPARDLPPLLRALLHALCLEAGGDWNAAHEIAQSEEGRDAAWVHAYLHRKEGDAANAGYWYRRAGRPEAHGAFDEEWREIARALLSGAAEPR